MSKKIFKTEIIKRNLKTFNKEVDKFNKRLKKAYKSKNIPANSYKTLIIDKDKKDFFRANIYTKKQFKKFVNNLKMATSKTLKAGKDYRSLGTILNDLATKKKKKKILKQQLKNEELLNKTFGTSYKDIMVNVALESDKGKQRQRYDKLFNRLLKINYEMPNKDRVFKQRFIEIYKERFGVEPNLKGITIKAMRRLARNPRFDLNLLSDPTQDDVDVKEEFDELLRQESKIKDNESDNIEEVYY